MYRILIHVAFNFAPDFVELVCQVDFRTYFINLIYILAVCAGLFCAPIY